MAMDEIEPLHGSLIDEHTPIIQSMAAAAGFRFGGRGGRSVLAQGRRNSEEYFTTPDDSVELSAVAHVSLLDGEGKSVSAIASELGLTTEDVLTDIQIAASISHPS